MKVSKIIIYVLAGAVLFAGLWGCARKEDRPKEESEAIAESNGKSLTDDGQAIKSEEVTSEATKQEIAAKDEKEMGQDGEETLEKQVEEVRKTFLSLQEVCKANDIEGYLDFWDNETKMEVEKSVRDLGLDERRERQRESLAKRPGMLQEIANADIKSITVDTSQAEKVEEFFGTEIKGTMMLVRTDGRAFLFHETDKGWKLFTIAPAEYFR
jgi:FtsZ-interacting cell division protein ZipA